MPWNHSIKLRLPLSIMISTNIMNKLLGPCVIIKQFFYMFVTDESIIRRCYKNSGNVINSFNNRDNIQSINIKGGLFLHASLNKMQNRFHYPFGNDGMLCNRLYCHLLQIRKRGISYNAINIGLRASRINQPRNRPHWSPPNANPAHLPALLQKLHNARHILALINSQTHKLALREATPRKIKRKHIHSKVSQRSHVISSLQSTPPIAVKKNHTGTPFFIRVYHLVERAFKHQTSPI